MENKIKKLGEKYANYATTCRAYLHENPELSSQEFQTSKYLKDKLKNLDLEIIEVEGRGLIAVLERKSRERPSL